MTALVPGDRSPIIARPTGRPEPGWTDADYSIDAGTAERLLSSSPENTERAYANAWGQFASWCGERGRLPLPATAQTLTAYADWLVEDDGHPATIEHAVWTIRAKHKDAGYKEQPDTRATLKLLRAHRKRWAKSGGETRQAKPVLLDALRAMVATCDLSAPVGQRDRALLLIGFNGMCRRSEVSALNIGDLQDAGDDGMTMAIRYSKTDQEAEGVTVAIPYGQHESTCAVRASRLWVATLAEHGITTGALFRPIDRHGHIGGEPTHAGRGGDRLTPKWASDIVLKRARLAGLEDPAKYTFHGLRAGAATCAYKAGAPVSEIAKHGRWSVKSPVLLGYIRAVDKWTDNPMKGVGL